MVRIADNTRTFLQGWRESPAFRTGGQTNHIELTCAGSRISAEVNGVVVASVSDSTSERGTAYIGVDAADNIEAEAHFDNFVITQR